MEYADTPQTGVEAHERVAAAMYPEKPARVVDAPPNSTIAELRATDPARTLYPYQLDLDPRDAAGAPRALALALSPAASAAQLEQQSASLAAIATDIGADQQDLKTWAGLVTQLAEKPLTEAGRRSEQVAAIAELRQTYGADFDSVVRDAAALAQRDSRLLSMLEKTGIRFTKPVITRLAELGRNARLRGQLK